MKKYIMALDQGTTSCRSILFDRTGQMISASQKEFTQYYPKEGLVEHDPEEIWNTQLETARSAMKEAGISAEEIAAIGITNQRETTVVWDRETGKPVYPAIVWQDRRTAVLCDMLKAGGWEDRFYQKTGLKIDSYFSATKIHWILNHVPGSRQRAAKGELLFGTMDTWLIWNLTAGRIHATDYSNASRTMLYNIEELSWDQELMDTLDIPAAMLPEVRPSSGIFGETDPELLGGAIPVSGAAGDQQCALFGQTCFEPGTVKNTYGTGCFLLMNTGEKPIRSKYGLLTTIAWGESGKVCYALEGSVFVAGAAIQWLRDELKLLKVSSDSEAMALAVKDTGGVYLVPAFVGLGAPYWDPYARGILTGLTRGTNRNHIVRAALESMAFQTWDVLKSMEKDAGKRLKSLQVDGGATANDFLMQFQADLLNIPVKRPVCIETTALGAAYFAGLAVSFWNNKEEIKGNWNVDRTFEPDKSKENRKTLLSGWKHAVKQAQKHR